MNRRGFLQLLSAGAFGAALAPELVERLLWVPGQKKIFLPSVLPLDDTAMLQVTFDEWALHGAGPLILPPGRVYYLSAPIRFPSGLFVQGGTNPRTGLATTFKWDIPEHAGFDTNGARPGSCLTGNLRVETS